MLFSKVTTSFWMIFVWKIPNFAWNWPFLFWFCMSCGLGFWAKKLYQDLESLAIHCAFQTVQIAIVIAHICFDKVLAASLSNTIYLNGKHVCDMQFYSVKILIQTTCCVVCPYPFWKSWWKFWLKSSIASCTSITGRK